MASSDASTKRIEEILGSDAGYLLDHRCKTIPASRLHRPGPDFVDRVVADSDRPIPVLRSLAECSMRVRTSMRRMSTPSTFASRSAWCSRITRCFRI